MGKEHLHSLRVTLIITIHQGPMIREIKNQETYTKSSYISLTALYFKKYKRKQS